MRPRWRRSRWRWCTHRHGRRPRACADPDRARSTRRLGPDRPTRMSSRALSEMRSDYRSEEVAGSGFWNRRNEALDEREGLVGDVAPALIDDERVAPARNLDDLGHGLVVLLILVGGFGNRGWNRVILFAGDDQQWAAVGVLGVDLRFGPGVEVGGCCLKQRHA